MSRSEWQVAWLGRAGGLSAAVLAGGVLYQLVGTGKLTVNTGVGRRVRPLGPFDIMIGAPRETVFDVIAGPYLGRTPRAMADHVDVLERGTDMVLAAHHTPVGRGMTATTVETVRFTPPDRVDFRLLQGPVPHVVEQFTLADDNGTTRLSYTGELGTDFWQLGRWWGDLVAAKWETTVRESFTSIRGEAERRHRAEHRPTGA